MDHCLIPLLLFLFACVEKAFPAGCSEKNEFTCNSGHCINITQLCDGSADCYDESDETIAKCISHKCPANSFQCSYGGCIDLAKKCDGIEHCRDWSDEDADSCGPRPAKPTAKPTSGPSTQSPRPSTLSPEPEPINGCPLPEKPNGGDYEVLGCTAGDRSPKCEKIPGTLVKELSITEFSCSNGFALSGSSSSFCRNGKWNPPPAECQKLCPPLKSDSVDLLCYFLGSPINCTGIIKPGTKVDARCKPAFHLEHQFSGFAKTECLSDGTWADPLFSCIPDCGIINRSKQLISYAPETSSEYPWHAALYKNSGQEYICGGTIINERTVLTAAHCVVVQIVGSNRKTMSLDVLRVAVGKFRNSWSVKDPNEQKFKVTAIIPHDRYFADENRFDNDIAVLALSGTIIIKPSVMPVCIDWHSYYYNGNGNVIGTVVGWGVTESGEISEKLRVARLPYFDFDKCREVVSKNFRTFITSDKFCAGLHNGTRLGSGDSGGGYTIPKINPNNEMHFMYGIVSSTDPAKPDITTFTNVTYHIDWLSKVLTALKKSRRISV